MELGPIPWATRRPSAHAYRLDFTTLLLDIGWNLQPSPPQDFIAALDQLGYPGRRRDYS
jgi:hypothetical protein